jgi:hypothetical protein
VKLVSPVAFLATKHVAFVDRGKEDYFGSQDLEDFVAVVDGRRDIVAEIDQAPERLCYQVSAEDDPKPFF